MISLQSLKKAVADGVEILKKDKSLIEGVLYASSNRRVIGRLVYTHHIPCQGLEEPKSEEDVGISIQGYFRNGSSISDGRDRPRVGFGHVENDISPAAVRRALERAKDNAVYDPDFYSFPDPANEPSPKKSLADPKMFSLTPKEEAKLLADISFKTLEGALTAFDKYHRISKVQDPNFIVSGDNFLIAERMAVASTKGIEAAEENSIVLSFISAMVEGKDSKGRGWGAESSLKKFNPYKVGAKAGEAAVAGVGGIKIPSGKYTVVLGPQATMEIFSNLLLTSFSAASLDFNLSLFNGKFGEIIGSPLLTIYDDATYPDGTASKLWTDEGYRTAKIDLIKDGRFVGMLLNDYYRKKLLGEKDKVLKAKVGPLARKYLEKNLPRSGFRFSRGGGRIASEEPDIYATNLFITSSHPIPRQKIFEKVKNGVYIGALWYTYPIVGYRAGEITGTAIADTFLIKNGKLGKPIRVNSLRLHANLREIIKNIIAISEKAEPTILWASDEIAYAPEIAIRDVRLEAIQDL